MIVTYNIYKDRLHFHPTLVIRCLQDVIFHILNLKSHISNKLFALKTFCLAETWAGAATPNFYGEKSAEGRKGNWARYIVELIRSIFT